MPSTRAVPATTETEDVKYSQYLEDDARILYEAMKGMHLTVYRLPV
jgi:hypothetical protein